MKFRQGLNTLNMRLIPSIVYASVTNSMWIEGVVRVE